MAFLGIPIQHDCGRLLSEINVPGNKVPTNEYHISLFYFKYNIEISDLSKILEPTFNISSKQKPILLEIEEISCFNKGINGKFPIIGKINCKELLKLREKLRKTYNKNKIEYNKDHKNFIPHITLSYSDKYFEDIKIEKMPLIVNELIIWGGNNGDNRISINFPLKNPKIINI